MILYNLGIIIYRLLIGFASLFNEKARLWISGRQAVFKDINEKISNSNMDFVWFHCASLGEFEQGRPIIEKLRSIHPEYKILLTFFSPSGFEVRKNYEFADYVFYLPIDTPSNAKKFVEMTNPKMAFFIKYEFWYHYLAALKAKNIPSYSVSAIFRPSQIFFKPYGGFYRNMLKLIDGFYVQNKQSAELLSSININSVIVGDSRFDRVKAITESKKELTYIKRFKKDNRLFVIGSSWNADIDVLAGSINDLYLDRSHIGGIKIVIAPHEISSKSIGHILNKIKRPIVLYSELQNKDVSSFDVIIIDNVGMLSSIYAYADFAYVGGAFGKGLHNILEAATFGMPIFFGTYYQKFQEAIDLVNQGGAFSIKSSKDFDTLFKQIAGDEEYFNQCKELTRNYVMANVGATDKILGHLKLLS